MNNLPNLLDIFLVIADIVISIHIFHEINSNNPYKYKRTAISIALAACFAVMLSSKRILALAGCTIGTILIFVQQIYDFKDAKYSINRSTLKYKRKVHK